MEEINSFRRKMTALAYGGQDNLFQLEMLRALRVIFSSYAP
jgi:hypothetical protein